MKTASQIVAFLCLAILITCCGWCGLSCYQPVGLSYDLRVDGDRLFLVDYQADGTATIIDGAKSPVATNELADAIKFTIYDAKGKVAFRSSGKGVKDLFWSDPSQTLYVLSHGGKFQRWTRNRELERLPTISPAIDELRESVDGRYLCGVTDSTLNNTQIVTISTRDFTYTERMVLQPTYWFIMVDPDHLLVNRENLEILTLSTGECKPLSIPDDLYSPVNYRNRVWAIRRKPGELYDIVQLDPTLAKIEQVVAIPADYPKPVPPHRRFSLD